MASKPETTFYQSVHRHLPAETSLHREKMANPYRGGTADHWYSGTKADLWVEWKFIKLPARDKTIIKVGLSPLQLDWMKRRYEEGRNVWVIVGFREGGVIMRDLEWEDDWMTGVFKTFAQTRQSIALAIKEHCL